MSAESRALVDALLMLFEVLMAVFMEKHTPKSSANSSLPASQSPNDETARTRPAPRARVPHTTTRAAPTPAPANTSSAQRRCVRALWRRPHRLPPAQAASGAPSSTSCSRRWCATPTHKSSTARAATPRRAHASPSRCPDPCSTAPASRPTSCTCSSRRCSRSNVSPNRCTPSSAHPLRGHAPRLRRPAPSRARRVGEPRHRAPARLTSDARRRDLVARGPEKSLDSRL